MDNTNSLVLVGTLYDDAVVEINNKNIKCSFILQHHHKNQTFTFTCVTRGEQARYFKDMLKKGAYVRLAGGLRQNGIGVYILAEHLEVRENSNTFTSEEDND